MKVLYHIAVIFCLAACSSTQKVNELPKTEDNKQTNQVVEIVTAKVIRKKAYNKAGKEMPYAGDFYLLINGKEIFVKLMTSKVSSEDLEPLIDQKASFKISRHDGLWDTDDPNVQSRIGPYVAILEIL